MQISPLRTKLRSAHGVSAESGKGDLPLIATFTRVVSSSREVAAGLATRNPRDKAHPRRCINYHRPIPFHPPVRDSYPSAPSGRVARFLLPFSNPSPSSSLALTNRYERRPRQRNNGPTNFGINPWIPFPSNER